MVHTVGRDRRAVLAATLVAPLAPALVVVRATAVAAAAVVVAIVVGVHFVDVILLIADR